MAGLPSVWRECVRFTTRGLLLASLHAARVINAHERRFHTLARAAASIDGFSLKLLRVPQDEDFHDLVAARNKQGATIVTSDLVVNDN